MVRRSFTCFSYSLQVILNGGPEVILSYSPKLTITLSITNLDVETLCEYEDLLSSPIANTHRENNFFIEYSDVILIVFFVLFLVIFQGTFILPCYIHISP